MEREREGLKGHSEIKTKSEILTCPYFLFKSKATL